MTNGQIAARLTELADLLEIRSANPFRVRAYRSAARTFKTLPEPAAERLAAGEPLTSLKGVGKDLAASVAALAATGTFDSLEEARAQVPPGVRAMLRLPGLGPKKVGAIARELGLTTLEELKAAAADGRLAGLSGFGTKTAEKILADLPLVEAGLARALLARALPVAEELAAAVRAAAGVTACEPVGSARRRCETVGDVDLSAAAEGDAGARAAVEAFCTHPRVAAVAERTVRTARVALTDDGAGGPTEAEIVVNPPAAFGAGLILGTGSKAHLAALRRRVAGLGLNLDDAGLSRGGERLESGTEAAVYRQLGLACIPPELREGTDELALAAADALPALVELADLRGDLHMHTVASDGAGTVAQMAAAAAERGLDYIAITDHSQRVSLANGLDAARLRTLWAEIDRLNAASPSHDSPPVRVLKGVECDILENGALDLDDDVLGEADWVVAVLHYGLRQGRAGRHETLDDRLRKPARRRDRPPERPADRQAAGGGHRLGRVPGPRRRDRHAAGDQRRPGAAGFIGGARPRRRGPRDPDRHQHGRPRPRRRGPRRMGRLSGPPGRADAGPGGERPGLAGAAEALEGRRGRNDE